jgi:hypothetical protein
MIHIFAVISAILLAFLIVNADDNSNKCQAYGSELDIETKYIDKCYVKYNDKWVTWFTYINAVEGKDNAN